MKYIEDTGTVIESGPVITKVRLDHRKTEDCGSCCACSAFSRDDQTVELQQTGFENGERVFVRIPVSNKYLSILFVFFIPLIMFMAGIYAGQQFHGEERLGMAAAAGGAAGLVLAFVFGAVANRLLTPEQGPEADSLAETSGEKEDNNTKKG